MALMGSLGRASTRSLVRQRQKLWGGATTFVAILAIVLTALVLNQSAIHWRENMVDSDMFVYFGWCIAEGARPYLDVWDNKPPGIWWVNAATTRLVGVDAAGEVVAGTMALVITLLATIGISRRIYQRELSVLAAALIAVALTDPHLECGANRTETWLIACECTAMLAYLQWLRRGGRGWLLLCGLGLGCAPLFKQSGLAAAAAIGLHLMWLQYRRHRQPQHVWSWIAGWRPWGVLMLGCLAPILSVATVLAVDGALPEAAFAVGRFNRAYFAIGDASWLRVDRAIGQYTWLLLHLSGMIALAAAGMGCRILTHVNRPARETRPPRRAFGPLLLWVLFAFYLACVGPGRRGHHLMPILPALALLAIYPYHLLAGRRGLVSQITRRPAAAVAIVAFMYVLIALAAANHGALRNCWAAKPHWLALDHKRPRDEVLRGTALRAMTTPAERVYVWGWSPGTYRYAHRLPASRFATFEKLGQVGHHAQFVFDGALADLRTTPPAVIVISPPDYAGLRRSSTDDAAAWVRDHYRLHDTIAGMHFLSRAGQTAPEP